MDHDETHGHDDGSPDTTRFESDEGADETDIGPSQGDASDTGYDAAGAALGVLSPDEAAAVLAAAQNDPALANDLAEFQAVVAELARMGPSASINRGRSAGIRSRLVSRAAASRIGRPVPRQSGPISLAAINRPSGDAEKSVTTQTPPSGRPERRGTTRLSTERRTGSNPVTPAVERRGRFWKRALGGLAAAAVLLTAAGVFQLWRDRDVRYGGSAAAAVAATSIATHDSLFQTVLSLREQLAKRDSMIAALRNPRTRVVELASYSPPTPPGRAFWDQSHQHLMLTINGMKPPATGRTYQLWVMARGHAQPISAGTFAPDSSGRAEMTMPVPVEPGRLRRVAITEEPMGGSPAPTGAILFASR